MNIELLKPVETGAGRMQPFLRISKGGNKLQFNKTARSLLDIDEGGAVQFARDQDTGHYYVISVADKRATNLFNVSKNGTLSDLLLPAKLQAWAGGEANRIYISPAHVSVEGKKAFILKTTNA